MIGVAVSEDDRPAAAEFFEFCKTPWEFLRTDGQYEIVVSSITLPLPSEAPLRLHFGIMPPTSGHKDPETRGSREGACAIFFGRKLPIYGSAATFSGGQPEILSDEGTNGSMVHAERQGSCTIVRVGYGLFEEVRHLLTEGQPKANAAIPTLELHIELLRELVARSGAYLIEIPPLPFGHGLICSPTHDVDHPLMRNHWLDRTMFGFAYRATVGSVASLWRGRSNLSNAAANAAGAASLPFVRAGLATDPWAAFDRYTEIDPEGSSTFFLIPAANQPGRAVAGQAPAARGCKYNLSELTKQISRISSKGCEIGLHGIDAWWDEASARRERALIARRTGAKEMGVRMHWLYSDSRSPAVLDSAGFTYDSSFGYNGAVGFRAGSAQAYKPLSAASLLELPLIVMDTALFYPDHMNLKPQDAWGVVRSLIDKIEHFGGVLTINWHDRSLFPERNWGAFYRNLLSEVQIRGAWFATASSVAAWFRKRRSASVRVRRSDSGLAVTCSLKTKDRLPALRLRVHHPRRKSHAQLLSDDAEAKFFDFPFNTTNELKVAM